MLDPGDPVSPPFSISGSWRIENSEEATYLLWCFLEPKVALPNPRFFFLILTLDEECVL